MGNDAFSDLKKDYTYNVPAYALLFSDAKGYKALRVDAPDIGKEFTDSVYIGRDPEGFLYYNDLESFSQHDNPLASSDPVYYLIQKLNNPSDGKLLVKITFTRQGADDPHAVFLAEDPLGSVDAAGMNNYTNNGRPGKWNPLELGAVNATIYKKSDEHLITVTIASIHKKVTITNNENFLRGKRVSVDGILHFKDINTLSTGIFANWNDDRVVFFNNDYSGNDFVGFFIPYEYSVDTLQYKPANTPTALTFENVTWSST
jgi:hypothetical protein